jgi:hypothetical protein
MSQPQSSEETKREEFPDGSAIITYADGTMVILETRHARETSLRGSHPADYGDPPPPPPGRTPPSAR